MLRKFLIILIALFTVSAIEINAKKDVVTFDYELEAPADAYNGVQVGWKVIKVWSMGKLKDLNKNVGCRNAIHGILFKGFSPAKLQAMCPDGYQAHKEYFDNFFSNEANYMQFVELTNKGAQQAGDIINCGKFYKMGLLVKININGLRKKLEADGIAKNTVQNIFGGN